MTVAELNRMSPDGESCQAYIVGVLAQQQPPARPTEPEISAFLTHLDWQLWLIDRELLAAVKRHLIPVKIHSANWNSKWLHTLFDFLQVMMCNSCSDVNFRDAT